MYYFKMRAGHMMKHMYTSHTTNLWYTTCWFFVESGTQKFWASTLWFGVNIPACAIFCECQHFVDNKFWWSKPLKSATWPRWSTSPRTESQRSQKAANANLNRRAFTQRQHFKVAWHLRPTTSIPTTRPQATRTCGTLLRQPSFWQPFAKKAKLSQPTSQATWWCPTGTKWCSAQHQQPRWWTFSLMQQGCMCRLNMNQQFTCCLSRPIMSRWNIAWAWGPTALNSSTEVIKFTPNFKWSVDMPSAWLRMNEPQHSCGRSRQQMVATLRTRLPKSCNGAMATCSVSTLPSTSWRLWTTEVHGTRPFATAWNTVGPKCCDTCQQRQHQGPRRSWQHASSPTGDGSTIALLWCDNSGKTSREPSSDGVCEQQLQHGRARARLQQLSYNGEHGDRRRQHRRCQRRRMNGNNTGVKLQHPWTNGILKQQRWVQHGLPQLSVVQWGQQHPSRWVGSISAFRFNRCTILR